MTILRSIGAAAYGVWQAVRRSDFLFDTYVLSMIGIGAIANVAAWVYFKHALGQPADAFVTLHFTVATGADLIGEAASLYHAPLLVGALSLLNIAIARLLYNYDTLLAYLVISVLPVANAAMLFNSVLLVSVNA